MSLSEIMISRTSLIIGAVLLLLLAVNIFIMLLVKRKQKQKLTESREYKEMSKVLESRKLKEVKVKPSKVSKDPDCVKPFKLLKSKSKFSLAFYRQWFIEKYFPAKSVLINMELVNGFHRLFIVVEKEGGFVFRGKKYIFDDDSKYYNMDAKLYVFDYHEGITLPIKRKIPVSAIKKTIESTEEIDIEYAINPSTLQRFMTAKIAEGVMKGTMLDEFLKKLQMFIIVIMVIVAVHFALFLWASKILENINLPF